MIIKYIDIDIMIEKTRLNIFIHTIEIRKIRKLIPRRNHYFDKLFISKFCGTHLYEISN